MRLVHYFVTEQNYSPIVVKGVKDEVWLQNQDGPYKIIRINCNYIHNNEQLNYDLLKLKNVMRQVKRKTVSFSMNALNILLDVGENVNMSETKNINSVIVKNISDVKENAISKQFPDINNKLMLDTVGLDLIINVTNDLNKKTEKDNQLYEKTFQPKRIVFTNALIFINVLIFIVVYCLAGTNLSGLQLLRFGGVYAPLVKFGVCLRELFYMREYCIC